MDNTSEFMEFKKSNEDKNSAWQHFLRSNDGTRAKCKICNKVLKNSSSTTPLHNHLKQIHSINVKERKENVSASSSNTTAKSIASTSQMARTGATNEVNEPPKKKTKVTQYFKSDDSIDSVEGHISKLAAIDGLSFNVISMSTTLRKLFTKSGYNLPKSPHTIKQIVLAHSEQIKLTLAQEIKQLKTQDCCFSCSLDEWTSTQNIRYMNINIHSPKLKQNGFKNLGLLRIHNKGTSQNLLKMLEEKLTDFGLTFNDVICLVTDGASVMCALGRQTSAFHQLCYAHGIQLAVLDIIYKKKSPLIPNTASSYLDPDVVVETDILEIDSDLDFENNEEVDDEEGLNIAQTRPSALQLADTYKELIQKVRSVVKLFKKSPTKSDLLYKNAEEDKKNIHLILDCKTRWSSLANMISRSVLLKQPVLKSLIDLKSPITFSEEEFHQLEEIADSLSIIKTTVEALCQRDANLLTAEIAMKFMIQKLYHKQSQLSMQLVDALKERIAQRRLTEVIGTLKYLHNPTNFYKEGLSVFPFENPTNERVNDIIMKLNAPDESIESQILNLENQIETVDVSASLATKSMKEQLQDEIEKAYSADKAGSNTQQSSCDLDLETQIKVERALFDSGGKRSDKLQRAYNALLTIPPTSVESERVFSAAGYLCNHLRSRMNQDSLDALSFLRSHYQTCNAE